MQLSLSSELFPSSPWTWVCEPAAGQGFPKAILPQEASVLQAQGPPASQFV